MNKLNPLDLFKGFCRQNSRLLGVVIAASVLLNVFVFAGSIYMLLIYDLILPSRSLPTLFSLFGILAIVYVFQAIFDYIRSQALAQAAKRLYRDMAPRVHYATSIGPTRRGPAPGDGLQSVRDLDQVYSYLSGNGPLALIDLPWVIVFLLVLTFLHIWLGVAALISTIILAAIAWFSNAKTREISKDLAKVTGERQRRIQSEMRFAETSSALGMEKRLLDRTHQLDEQTLGVQSDLVTVSSKYGAAGKVFRLFVQSLVLTVGAVLVIDGQASGGIIIASSILAGRALAPVDQAIANLRPMIASINGWKRIVEIIDGMEIPAERDTQIALPESELSLNDVWVIPPGTKEPVVEAVRFKLEKGQALALIGPSGAGKSSLAKAILGIWQAPRGEIRFDGALHNQWDSEVLGRSFGYVSQSVDLIGGTVAQNIARFDPEASSEDIIEAAKAAGMHEVILALSNGYDTPISDGGGELSAGQRQRLGLARALYGKPFLLVLDEANSNLDAVGDGALANALNDHRERGGIAIVITHRPASLAPISHVGVMKQGRLVDFGPRDDVLKRTLKSVEEPDRKRSSR